MVWWDTRGGLRREPVRQRIAHCRDQGRAVEGSRAEDQTGHRHHGLRALLENKNINSIIISATPETTHYPMAKESLLRASMCSWKSRLRSNSPKRMN